MAVILFVRISSDLDPSIPEAYEATEIRREVYSVLYPLHPARGPLPREE